jgi:hypothetical protein
MRPRRSQLLLIALTAFAVVGCVSARNLDPSSSRTLSGPCNGLGEMFSPGLPEYGSTYAPMATITRRAVHRGVRGVCYTTPESMKAVAFRKRSR